MHNSFSILLLSSTLAAAVPALAQTDTTPPPASDKPPATVPEGGRGLPARNPDAVPTVPSGGRGMNDVNGATGSAGATDLVDVNTASQSDLQSKLDLKSSDAKAIVKYRTQYCALTSQAQISSISGLSREAAEKMNGRVRFGTLSPGAGKPNG